jgi:hypothetical protein
MEISGAQNERRTGIQVVLIWIVTIIHDIVKASSTVTYLIVQILVTK